MRKLGVVTAGLFLAACGGKAIVEQRGEGGDGGLPAVGGIGNTGGFGNTGGVGNMGGIGGVGNTGGVGNMGGVGNLPNVDHLEEIPLGFVSPNTVLGFDIPDNALGFSIYAKPQGDFDPVGIAELFAPTGEQVITAFGYPGSAADYQNFGHIAASVPQSSAMSANPPAPGAWSTLIANQFGGNSEADVSVWVRQTADGDFHGGVIDINVYVVPAVFDDAYIAGTIMNSFSGYVGLQVGSVNLLPLDPSFTIIDQNNFFDGLLQTQLVSGSPTLNILAVAGFAGDLEGAAGVAGGVPGNFITPGTTQSGVYWQVLFDPFFDPIILQHETGHLSGLFHTSEFVVGFHDPLVDTPECIDVLAQGPGCPDFDNIMFPTGGSGASIFSNAQSRVIQGSALYRGITVEGGNPAPPFAPSIQGQSISAAELAAYASATGHAGPTQLGGSLSSAAPWASHLPAPTHPLLLGIGCAGDARAPADVPALIRDAANGDLDGLVKVGLDEAAPPLARARALSAAGTTNAPAHVAQALKTVALSKASGPVRAAAYYGLKRSAPTEAAVVAGAMRNDADPVARAAARR